nr:SMC-Scp complex subunit ScpB [Solimonas marina]
MPNTADARIAELDRILEAILQASEQPLSTEQLQRMLGHDLGVTKKDIREGLERLAEDLAGRAVELSEVASGWRIQVRRDYAEWVARLYQEKPPRLSRALLETLALICYRQPITRGEIEDVRGVAMSPNIIRTLLERGWIREVGVKEVPGRPSLFGTTSQLLDDLNLRSLDDLPTLPEIKDSDQLEAALQKLGGADVADGEPNDGDRVGDAETPASDAAGEAVQSAEANPDEPMPAEAGDGASGDDASDDTPLADAGVAEDAETKGGSGTEAEPSAPTEADEQTQHDADDTDAAEDGNGADEDKPPASP